MLAILICALLSGAPASNAQQAPAAAELGAAKPIAEASTTLEVANRCTGPAQGLPFLTPGQSHDGPACTLHLQPPRAQSAEDAERWGPSIPRIHADIYEVAKGCSEAGYPGVVAPTSTQVPQLFLRITGAERVAIDSRPLRGKIEENNFLSEGWGEWTQVYASPVTPGQVLEVPIAELNSGALTLFEVRIRAGDQVQQFGVSFPAFC